jgi:AcrR family transcriptional regulator
MNQPVKAPGRRAGKAAATRRRVLGASESLFTSVGYAAATIAAIAEKADVAVQTVYAVFGNKRTILTELLAARVVGDDDERPLMDRAEWREMEDEPDPRRQLALLAAIATRIGSRMGALYGVLAAAAGSDADIAELYQRQQESRYRDQQLVASALARKQALRPGLSETRATDIMWAVANPTMHSALVGERNWPEHEYEEWLTRTITCALLSDQPA